MSELIMASAPSEGSLIDWAQRLADAADTAAANRANEEELRLDLNPVIVQAVEDLFGLEALSSTAERSGHRSVRRRYDNLYGGVVVEWEWDMSRSRREHGAQQALDYLSDLRRQVGTEEVFTAAVCDGKQWGFLVVDPDEQNTLLDTAPTTASEYFDWRPNTSASCRRFLELIGSNRQRPITGSALSSAFGPDSNTTRTLVTLLAEGLAGRSADGRIDVLYREYRRALDVVYGDLDATSGNIAEVVADVYGLRIERPIGEYLFVLHTYFALVARFFAIELLAITTEDRIHQPTAWISVGDNELIEHFNGLDNGELPGGLRIDNLFESDVFGWWVTLCRGNTDLLSALRNVLSALADFAFPRTIHGPQRATDVLSDLYQSLVPRQMRRNLGEFLTPHWLAQACLDRLRSLGAPIAAGRVIDPTCGTGTFLMPILSDRLSNLRRSHAVDDITSQMVQGLLDGVAGIDINPVAVTATRVNYVLALGILARNGALTLPVWRADSLLVPDSPPRQGAIDEGDLADRQFRELKTSLEEPFRVPPLLSTAERMAVLRHLLEEALHNESEDQGRETLLITLDQLYSPAGETPATASQVEWDNERVIIRILYDQMRLLQEQGKNGIWAQIIANAYAPLFAGKYDVVVGNPPWLAWGRLPAAWRQGSPATMA